MQRSGAILDGVLRARNPLATSLAVTVAIGIVPLATTALFPATLSLLPTPAAYLAFHTTVEIFRVVVAFSIFGVGWYTHDLSSDRHALFLACAFLAIGLIDLMHTLSYPGMPDFFTPSSTNKASQLWVAARFFSGVAFLACAFVPPEKERFWLRRWVLGTAALATAGGVFVAVTSFPEHLPAMFVPGAGQTTFKRVAEYVIIALLLGAIAAHGRRYSRTRDPSAVIYVSAFALCALSEACFATHREATDPWNALGHAYKAAAFYLVYRGMFIASVRRPHAKLLDTTGALEREMAKGAAVRLALARSAGELAEQRDRIAAVMEACPVGMTRLERGGRVVYANAAVERILGVHREKITTWQYDSDEWRITDPAGAPLTRSELPFAVVARTRAPVRMRHAVQRPDGGRVLLDVFGAPLLDATGAFDGAVITYEDVTERSQVEERLRQAQKMEAVGRLAGGVAHDFNNLLTAILASSDHLLEELPDDSPVRTDASEIRQSAERATTLTRRLLAFSRKQLVVPRVLALADLVTGLLPMLRRLIGDDVELVACNSGVGLVRVDPGQLEQVIVNLVVNARDAMPDGGRITLETHDVEVGFEEAHQQLGVHPGPFVVLVAGDTGTGMDAEVLSHLFEPFYTTKEPGKGTGLGLSTLYGIVEQAGGHVRVESTPGVGTVFRIYLPRVEAAEEPCREPRRAVLGAPDPAAVLLVEDEPQVRTVIAKALRRAGHYVMEAAGADDGLRLAADLSRRIDVLVTDVMMPRVGGKELAARVRALRPGLRVLFVSGYVDPGFSIEDLGPDTGYLQKPFTPGALVEALRALLAPAPAMAAGR